MNYVAGYVGDNSDQMKIRRFEKQREERRKQIDDLKKLSTSSFVGSGTRQFASSKTAQLEQRFKQETIGLVSKAEFIEKRKSLEEKMLAQKFQQYKYKKKSSKKTRSKQLEQEKEKALAKLSFLEVENGDKNLIISKLPRDIINNETISIKKKNKLIKNPNVDTSFLPDRQREKAENLKRKNLELYWRKKQEETKNKSLEITYSYWDGTGHKRKIVVKQGNTIGEFLSAVQKQLAPDFRDVRSVSSESLMYVTEDTILPHHHTFYDLIINESRARNSEPLFNFYVKENTRPQQDISRDKLELQAGKVVERHWYDMNKHIFPASRWERYNSQKE